MRVSHGPMEWAFEATGENGGKIIGIAKTPRELSACLSKLQQMPDTLRIVVRKRALLVGQMTAGEMCDFINRREP